jgi:cell volume regulation protein A
VPPLTGLLLGSIVASTDAAAVVAVLRSQGVHLRERLAATLEIESGSNDPMAIFLTVGLVEVLAAQMVFGWDLATLFAAQMGLGAVVGLGVGLVGVQIINRIRLSSAGLYPVLAGACGFTAFGLAATLGGSGFLAIYLAGIVIGNSRVVFQRGTFLFVDGLAWMGQFTMFVVLGLLSTPSELLDVAAPGLLLAAVLILVARPLAVVPPLWPFRFSWQEQVLVAWVGLRGAVPIILATFPMMYGIPAGKEVFNVVFFVVLVSAVLQGWTLPALATRLRLQESQPPGPAVSLELMSLRDVQADSVDYLVVPSSPLVDKTVQELRLPEGAILATISRGNRLVAPRGSTELQPNDHLFIILGSASRRALDQALGVGRS